MDRVNLSACPCCCWASLGTTREGAMHIHAVRVKRSSEHCHITHTLNLVRLRHSPAGVSAAKRSLTDYFSAIIAIAFCYSLSYKYTMHSAHAVGGGSRTHVAHQSFHFALQLPYTVRIWGPDACYLPIQALSTLWYLVSFILYSCDNPLTG